MWQDRPPGGAGARAGGGGRGAPGVLSRGPRAASTSRLLRQSLEDVPARGDTDGGSDPAGVSDSAAADWPLPYDSSTLLEDMRPTDSCLRAYTTTALVGTVDPNGEPGRWFTQSAPQLAPLLGATTTGTQQHHNMKETMRWHDGISRASERCKYRTGL